MQIIVKAASYLLSILSGILVGTSYIPFPPWAIFFCFVPLWYQWLNSDSPKKIFWTGWVTQFVLTLIGFNWVSHTVHEFGHLPKPLALAVLGLFCAIAHLHIPLSGLAWWQFAKWTQANEKLKIFLLPVFMSLGERLYPMIFDWHLGYTWLWAGFPAYQLADIVGFMGLSTIGFYMNALFLSAVLAIRGRQSCWWRPVATALIAFALLNGAGYFHAQNLESPNKILKFMPVQANIGNQEKLMAEAGGQYRDIVIRRFVEKTDEGLKSGATPDFIVWPETAFPEVIPDPGLSNGFAALLREQIKKFGVPLITGGYSIKEGTDLYTNSFFIMNREGMWWDKPYHKTELLAFGEYIPFGETFPQFYEWLPYTGHFGRGPGPSVLRAGDVKIGAQICYEGLFDGFSRGLANKGAEIIVNVTNDSWYGTWQEPFQHLYMTLARAVEVRRPLIRSTNTGISTAILADGRILELSPLQKEWFHLYEVPYVQNPRPTAFMSWGYWLFPLFFLIALLGAAVKGRKRNHDQSRLG